MTHSDHALQDYCQQYPSRLRPFYQLHGACFAVAACPEIPPPEEWMAWMLTSDQPLSQSATDELAEHLMALLKRHLIAMREERIAFPDACIYRPDMANDSPLSQWLQGCLSVHQQLEPRWQRAWQKMQTLAPDKAPQAAKQLRHTLSMFSTFADLPSAKAEAEQKGNQALLSNLDAVAAGLPDTLKGYVILAGKLAAYLPNQFETYTAEPESAPQNNE